jgi:SAM-dependent methyltransferase
MDKTAGRAQIEYTEYVNSEWARFTCEPNRHEMSLHAVQGATVKRVLDVGCGAGQEMMPFVSRGAFGIGTDLSPYAGVIGRTHYAQEGWSAGVAFVRSDARALPFRSSAFDLIVCRVALPYMHNPAALAEMVRVLRPAGLLLLRIHHACFYVAEAWDGLRAGRILPAMHSARVLASGLVYHVTGRHVQNRVFTHETCQSKWLLKRTLAPHGMVILAELPDSNRLTPSFLIRKDSCFT